MEKARRVKHLSYNELLERKSRGLCFCCGERYHHQCAVRTLRVLILRDDKVPNNNEGDERGVAAMELEQGNESTGMECNLIELMGFSSEEADSCKTLHMEAFINEALVLILVDSGASQNFMAPQVVSSLDLDVDYSKKLAVKLGDGHRVFTVERCTTDWEF